MGKFLRSLTDGSLRCRYCGDDECTCMEEGHTVIRVVGIWKGISEHGSILVQFAKQKLANGKAIPSGHKIWIKPKHIIHIDELLKTITLDNDFVNRLRFN